MKIAIACGGPSAEHEVSLMSCQAILEAIQKTHHSLSVFYISKDLQATSFTPSDIFHIPTKENNNYLPLLEAIQKDLAKVDLVLLAGMHGEFAEDGKFQALLDFFDIKYSGSQMAASALCMDKYRAALVVKSNTKIKIPTTHIITKDNKDQIYNLKYPVVIKPNNLGSSVGVSMVQNSEEAKTQIDALFIEYNLQEILVQEKIEEMIEVSCGCLQDKDGNITQLPPVEIIPQTSVFFDYNAKYQPNASVEISPPKNLSTDLSNQISQIAAEIHVLLGCRLYSRSDFLIKGETIYYLETNTLPGMTKTSLLPKEAAAIGMSFSQLLEFLIQNSI